MTTKLAETMNKTVIIIHKPFIYFFKSCVSSLSVTSTNLEGISVFFFVFVFFHFTTLTIGMISFLNFFVRVKNQQTTQSTARGPLKTAQKC